MFKATGSATTSYPNRYYNVATDDSRVATTTKHIFAPDGTLLATVVGASTTASTTYLHPDHLGGTNVTTDEDGEVTQTLDHYPYGSLRIATGSFSEQRRFIGEEYDGDTEFSYLNARYYQGSRGQFMSQDPVFLLMGDPKRMKEMTQQELAAILADPQVLHSYSYARNNPLVLKDAKGAFIDVPWISNNPWFQDAASAAYNQGGAWRFAMDHPRITTTGIIAASGVGLVGVQFAGIPATLGTLEAYDLFSTAKDSYYVLTSPSGTYSDSEARIANGKAVITGGGLIASRFTLNPARYVYSALQSIIGSAVNISQSASNTQISPPSGSTSSYRTARSYGFSANTEVTAGNADAIATFISQLLK